jgi:hypothetical protein
MAHHGSHMVYTRLSLNNISALSEAVRWERKIANSKRTKKVTLAWELEKIEPPPQCSNPTNLRYAKHVLIRYYDQFVLEDVPVRLGTERNRHCLSSLGFITEDPANPESDFYSITRAGVDYCNWLRSKVK